jgi:hypothetical protein
MIFPVVVLVFAFNESSEVAFITSTWDPITETILLFDHLWVGQVHPRSQALFLSLLEGEKDPGWCWSRGSEHKIWSMEGSIKVTVLLSFPGNTHILAFVSPPPK